MRFEWDPEKARANFAKHGIAFEDAQLVWRDPLMALTVDSVVDGEERWSAVGTVGVATVLMVVHVYRGINDEQRVRIISARKATKHERRQYEDGGF